MDLYRRVRLACAEGMSQREAARHFNISRDSVAKMMAFSVPPGYRRTAPVKRPKLDAYTGIIDVKVKLTFYQQRKADVAEQRRVGAAARETPDRIIPLGEGTTGTSLTTPRNSERIVAEVYATGSGGGCEEYWYLTVPDAGWVPDGPYCAP